MSKQELVDVLIISEHCQIVCNKWNPPVPSGFRLTESTWGCALRERARCTYTCGAARPLRMSVLRLHSRSCALSANECAGLPSRAQPQEHREQLPAQSSLLSALTPGPTTLQTHHKPSVLPGHIPNTYACVSRRQPTCEVYQVVAGARKVSA